MRLIALIILLCTVAMGIAQESAVLEVQTIKIDITVRDNETAKAMPGATVDVFVDNELILSKESDSLGKVMIEGLAMNEDFVIQIRKDGFVSKMATLNTDYEYLNELNGSLSFPFYVSLFNQTAISNFSFLEETPMIEFYFDPMGYIIWDATYTKRMLSIVDKVKTGISFETVQEYYGFIDLAEEQFLNAELASATSSLRNAINIIPSEIKPKSRIAEINRIQVELKWNDEQCSEKAMELFDERDYVNAMPYFRMAYYLKSENKEVANKMMEIRDLIEVGEVYEANKFRKRGRMIDDADYYFDISEFDNALALYQNIAKLNPDMTYPILMIQEIKNKDSKKE